MKTSSLSPVHGRALQRSMAAGREVTMKHSRVGLGAAACLVGAVAFSCAAPPADVAPNEAPMPVGATALTAAAPSLGANASLGGKAVFAPSSAWNQSVAGAPVDPASATLIASIGADTALHPDFGANWDGGPFGIPYVVVPGTQPKVKVTFDYADESDPGPYPIPPSAPIEGGSAGTGDRHVLVIDRDRWKLYELFDAHKAGTGWHAGSGAVFDLTTDADRPAGWTSADAAGLPIFPGLVRRDEVVEQKVIRHALRFTVPKTRRAYVAPATHFASTSTSAALPPMGMRVRLKASFDISGYPAEAQVILKALKTYGMFLADNGSPWYLSGAPDARWNDEAIGTLKRVKGNDFEVVKMGPLVTR
jgi:hypothetical protein